MADGSASESGSLTRLHSPQRSALVAARPRLNLIGYATANVGLGVAVRELARAAMARGFDVALLDLDTGLGPGRKEAAGDLASLIVDSPDRLPPGINIFVMSPPYLVEWLENSGELVGLLERPDCTNVMFAYWELPVLPRPWARVLEMFDAVVAPTGYIESTLDRTLAGTRVLRGLQPIDIPPGIVADRARFGLPADAFVALASFDPLSDTERKNPEAAIAAFLRAFRHDARARLVVKLNVPASGYASEKINREILKPLVDRLRADERTIVIAEALAYRDVLSLYASADAYISLHRAEGLGLGLLESMALGKPVVATGWSGNMAFMSLSNACPVRHALVPMMSTHYAYTRDMKGLSPFWAEPDIEDAALWLRRLAADPALRASIGSQARERFLRYQTEAAGLGFLDDLVALREHATAAADALPRSQRRACVVLLQRQLRVARMTHWKRLTSLVTEPFGRHIGWRFGATRNS